MAAHDGRPGITDLNADNVQLSDLQRFPGMTGWFKPTLLSKLLLRVLLSDVFGQYADRRLIHAALDAASVDELRARADCTALMRPDDDGAVWLDYVADLGDGFDATYAIAYLIAQNRLAVGGGVLPRASALIMGGDEVYPTAARDDYIVRLRKPYGFALPDQEGGHHPPVFMLPGNHDWYDGLGNFLAIFCREKSTPIGSWRTRQRRSYFAAKLTDSWWLWAIDIALVHDMDQPQADYFVAIAEGMPHGANIILCSAEPGWYKAESKGDSYRTLSYAAWLAQNARKDLKIPLVLSGDSHHYARYSGAGTQYITCGGGGAFVHGTLDLRDQIKADWLTDIGATLSLKTSPDEAHAPAEQQACYPSQAESRRLLNGNLAFFRHNPQFSFFLGGLYALFAFLLSALPFWDAAGFVLLLLCGGFVAYTGYQEGFGIRVLALSVAHALAHFAAVLAGYALVTWLGGLLYPPGQWHWAAWLGFVAVILVPLGGVVAGTIFGLNLLLTCAYCGINHNDAFSAMKLDSHRHFLRIRIKDDALHVYPVALDRVPRRDEWRMNPARATDKGASVFLPPDWMRPRLIEGPIVIRTQHARSTDEVKAPSDMPSAPKP